MGVKINKLVKIILKQEYELPTIHGTHQFMATKLLNITVSEVIYLLIAHSFNKCCFAGFFLTGTEDVYKEMSNNKS